MDRWIETPTISSALPTSPPQRQEESLGELTQAEITAGIEARFERDGPQVSRSEWARRAEPKIENAILRHLPDDARLLGVECRDTLCRIEIRYRDRSSYTAAVEGMLFTAEPVWEGQTVNFILRENDNEVVSRSYFAKEGTLLTPED